MVFAMKIQTQEFYVGNEKFKYITLENASLMKITLSDCGASIKEVCVPDKFGQVKCVTLCPQNNADFVKAYHGKTIGRTAGRINNADFSIDGKVAHLTVNNSGKDCLHGGNGLHGKRFLYRILEQPDCVEVEFSYLSQDGEDGYFGNVKIIVTYRISLNENKFSIRFGGTTDQKTLLNLTNHVYWNLSGNLSSEITNHILYLNADKYGVLNERLVTEKISPINKSFNFLTPHEIGDFIHDTCVTEYCNGYDHPFFLRKSGLSQTACCLRCENSGINLQIKTTYPCVVVYTNNFPEEDKFVYEGVTDKLHMAVCLECQYHPDGIHQTPDNCGIFTPECAYLEETEYVFTAE